MSLRTKILLLFVALAIVPIVAVVMIDYLHSSHALHELGRARVESVTERYAREIGQRTAGPRLAVAELAESEAVKRLLRGGGDESSPAALAAALEARWGELRPYVSAIEIVDRSGSLVYRLADEDAGPATTLRSPCGVAVAATPITHPVRDGAGNMGWVAVAPRLEAVLPPELLAGRLGAGAYAALVDRVTGRVVHAQSCELVGQAATTAWPAPDWTLDPAALADADGVAYEPGGGDRFTAYVALAEPPWTVGVTASRAAFAAPVANMRWAYLLFIVFVAVGAGGAFSILLHGVMRSMRDLGRAAERIGRGDLTPWLPPPGRDEVGRLSGAFAIMSDKLRQSRRQLEISRQMAGVGKMAAYLAHEIRNPLSSIRLNLQGLARDAKRGETVSDMPVVLDLCLRETGRLETAVQSVLALGRMRSAARRLASVHAIVRDAVQLLRPQLEQKRVAIRVGRLAGRDTVLLDPEQIKGVLLNLLLNAGHAMPDGGTIQVWTEVVEAPGDRPVLAVHVRDEGPGVPPDLRERIFEPFFTTRPKGTGIGLSLSLQTVEAHEGRLYLAPELPGAGAEFVIELPLAPAPPGSRPGPVPAGEAAGANRGGETAGATAGTAAGGPAHPYPKRQGLPE